MAQTVSPLTAIAGNLANAKCVRLDISFKTPSHTGLQTTQLVFQFPAATPLALVLKQFLADRTLDQSYSGGLSSYCLVSRLLITRFLQHEHHLGRSINQNIGRLLMDFVYFFGNVFDPRQMRGSVQGSGIYRNRERGHSLSVVGRLKHRLGQQPNQPSKKMHWLKRKSPINVSRLGSFGRMVESRL
ncbi:unnamed protein product [Brassica oleracea var. botrytis]|uniref:PAP-associated domain-containing protein n=1 Tax=Brassica oleracea TaxID=3712 RepID=A0A3P6AI29_BRAOL|nr:unnamed protein product [Brassica oleracea]